VRRDKISFGVPYQINAVTHISACFSGYSHILIFGSIAVAAVDLRVASVKHQPGGPHRRNYPWIAVFALALFAPWIYLMPQ
jgi:hypothetical protein